MFTGIEPDSDRAYEVLRINTTRISRAAIDVQSLANRLFQCNIISEKEREVASNPYISREDRLDKLMHTVRATVRGNGHVFVQFIEILREGGTVAETDLANRLETCYHSSELSEVRSTCSTSKVINSPQVSGQYKKRQEQVEINQLLITSFNCRNYCQ